MEKLPPLEPIPSPAHSVWREVRSKFLPGVIFVVILGIVAKLWIEHVAAPSVLGEVEAITANVISTQPGTVQEMSVQRFDRITAGDPVVKVLIMDPNIARADLAVILADLKVLQVRMSQAQAGNEFNFLQLRLALMTAQVELAIAKVRLQQAESEFDRVNQLYKEQ